MDREVISQKIDLVVDRLMALGGADYAKDKMADSGNRFTGLIERDFGIEEWDWPQGLGLYGLIKCLQGKKHNRYMNFLIIGFNEILRSAFHQKILTPLLHIWLFFHSLSSQVIKSTDRCVRSGLNG